MRSQFVDTLCWNWQLKVGNATTKETWWAGTFSTCWFIAFSTQGKKEWKNSSNPSFCCDYTFLPAHFSYRNGEKIIISGQSNLTGVIKLLIPSRRLRRFNGCRSLPARLSAVLSVCFMTERDPGRWHKLSRPRDWTESRRWELSL